MSSPVIRYDPVPLNSARNASNPSLRSRSSANSGPSNKEPAFITSTWGIGWKTPALLISCYFLATVVAFTHLIFFNYINGKEADGQARIAPQSYVTTLSNFLANTFGFLLRASLGVAFAQHLWYILRVSALEVSTIEELFNLRSNPLLQFKPSALRATPLLCALAAVMWVSQFVTSFPPGAITVTSVQQTSFELTDVPWFDASYMGNGSGVDANAYSLSALTPTSGVGFSINGLSQNKDANLITRLTQQVLISGEAFTMPSPCGANCSYVVEFEGPYVECSNSSTVKLYDDAAVKFLIYSGAWFAPLSQSLNPADVYNETYTQNHFNSTTFNPLQANGTRLDGGTNTSVLMEQNFVLCVPGRANFTVNNIYTNFVQSRSISVQPIDPLLNLLTTNYDNVVEVPGFVSGSGLGTAPANWSTYALNYYRDNNLMTVVGSMMSWLQGGFEAYLANGDGLLPVEITPEASYLLLWDEPFETTTTGLTVSEGPQNNSIIGSTRFNEAFGQFSTSSTSHPSFNITQDLMNDYLFNITTSIMVAYGALTIPANTTKLSMVNVYEFSKPLNLVLPYFITLLFALPFVVFGFLALFNNGVSAMDGSFIQIISTSTGSATLDRAAAGGCLGGDESISQELKDLKIRFGEFIGRDEPGRIRRAGFGTEEEVTALTRGDRYGIANWI